MNRIGEPFVIFDSIESTNIHAMKLANDRSAIPGTVFFTRVQTGGKGQRGRKWESRHGQNILMSVVTEPHTPDLNSQFALSCATALACFDLFSRYAGPECAVKWPNDLYWRNRKAGGILIENILHGGNWIFAIIGIGININQTEFDPAFPNPVSLKQITGKEHDPVLLARELCGCLETRIGDLREKPFDLTLADYNSVLFSKGQIRKFGIKDSVIEGRVHSVTSDGTLRLEREEMEDFRYGELTWL